MIHDPTQVKRQGADVGDQYRSAIFCDGPEQLAIALKSKETRQARFDRPIATEIVLLNKFWPAEDYHQQYYARRSGAAACKI